MDGQPTESTPAEVIEQAPATPEINTAQSLFGSDSAPVETPAAAPAETNSVIEPVVPAAVAPVVPAPDNVVPITPATPATPAAPVTLTAEQLAVAKQMFEPKGPAVAAPSAPAPRQLTLADPEVRQQLGIYDLSEADYDSIFDVTDKKESIKNLNGVLQKVVTQAVTMSNVLVAEAVRNVHAQYSQYTSFADEQREQMLQYEFFTAHPDLQGQHQILGFVQKQMMTEGYKPRTKQEGFDEVAKRTKALIQQFAGNGQSAPTGVNPAPPVGQPAAVPASKPRMAALGGGGSGGGGGGAQGPAASGGSSTARSIFG